MGRLKTRKETKLMALAFDSDGYYVQVYSTEETPQTYSGTEEPPADLGKTGDIYIKVEE